MHTLKRMLKTALLLLMITAWCGGCSKPPAVALKNLQFIAALRTALSAQNPEWLAKVEAAIEKRRAAGEMPQDEYDQFQTIITQAKSGAWKEAELATFEWEQAQAYRDR